MKPGQGGQLDVFSHPHRSLEADQLGFGEAEYPLGQGVDTREIVSSEHSLEAAMGRLWRPYSLETYALVNPSESDSRGAAGER